LGIGQPLRKVLMFSDVLGRMPHARDNIFGDSTQDCGFVVEFTCLFLWAFDGRCRPPVCCGPER